MQGANKPSQAIVAPDHASGKIGDRRAGKHSRPPIRWRRLILPLLVAALLVTVGASGRQPANPLDASLDAITANQRFDLLGWEVRAVVGKADAFLSNPGSALSDDEKAALVVSHLQLARRAADLESAIEQVYADPNQADPEKATRGRRAELAAVRDQLTAQAPTAEAVLQGQLVAQIKAAGLTTLGQAFPPPQLSFTAPPQLLVVSPRDRIERLRSVDLVPDLDSADREELEQAVSADTGLSAYVTTIGGYGAWPTMVVDRFGLDWTLETIAHEWVHNYLSFHPLGWAFLEGGEAITINETVADIVGRELGQALLAAYYPEFLPPPPRVSEHGEALRAEPPPFDFGQEMRATRIRVDELLAEGRVEEAEAYMEARRQLFIENGYQLRVLNQAYFAFHGSYATGPAASDPIGPKLQELRSLSPSLADFLRLVDGMTSVADIDAGLQEVRGGG